MCLSEEISLVEGKSEGVLPFDSATSLLCFKFIFVKLVSEAES